ncbi:hypothetical protein HZA44_00140 [Candidatus Peregrinibacteria bacterium]|nr:hypothetical protein [Candidatus Peregrinibacteria bacterium]
MIEPQEFSASSEFASPEEALQCVATMGVDEASPRLIRHFGVPGKGVEFALFFGSLDIAKKTRFLELLLSSVFEDSDFSQDKAILSYRKKMAEQFRMRKGDTGSLQAAVSSVLADSPDGALLFLKTHPHAVKRFIGQLTQQNPDESNRMLSTLVHGLILRIPQATSDPDPIC